METNKYIKEDKYLRAKNKVKNLKGFYWHLAVYLVINSFITVNKIIRNVFENGETYSEAFWDFGTFAVWIFWGIGLVFHGMNVFGFPSLFGKDWEERKIKKIMEKDMNQYNSFK